MLFNESPSAIRHTSAFLKQKPSVPRGQSKAYSQNCNHLCGASLSQSFLLILPKMAWLSETMRPGATHPFFPGRLSSVSPLPRITQSRHGESCKQGEGSSDSPITILINPPIFYLHYHHCFNWCYPACCMRPTFYAESCIIVFRKDSNQFSQGCYSGLNV